MKMTFSFVIPTKNRPVELATVFDAILAQSRLPEQVIIIDQSSPDKVIKDQLALLAKKVNIRLDYIHDETINGLVQAKAASIQYNQCDYISFFDDDIVHEPNYLAAIEEVIIAHPVMIGFVNGLAIVIFLAQRPFEVSFDDGSIVFLITAPMHICFECLKPFIQGCCIYWSTDNLLFNLCLFFLDCHLCFLSSVVFSRYFILIEI